MEDTGKSYLIGVRVSSLEKEAIRRKAAEEGTSQSSVAHDMMRRGNLPSLVAFYFGEGATKMLHERDNDEEH